MIKTFILFIALILSISTFSFATEYTIHFVSADFCSACKQMDKKVLQDKKIVELLKKNNLIIKHLDYYKDAKQIEKYKVKSIPILVILQKEKEIVRFTGYTSVDKLEKALKDLKNPLDKVDK
jgi:thiol-disulfide isomerase/thioredoxin